MAKKRKWLKRIGKAALAAGAAYAGSKFLASQKPGWGVNKNFTDMDKNVGKTTDWITKKKTILPPKKPDIPFNWNPFKKDFWKQKIDIPFPEKKSVDVFSPEIGAASAKKGKHIRSYDDGGEIVIGKNVDKDLL
jgi:hypothetical protein